MIAVRLTKIPSPATIRMEGQPKVTKRPIIFSASSVFPIDKEIKINSKPKSVKTTRNSLARRGICSRLLRRSVGVSEREFVAMIVAPGYKLAH